MLEKRIWIIGNLAILLLALLSTRIVYWQLIRGQELRPVAINPVQSVAEHRKLYDRSDPVTEEALALLMAQGEVITLEDLPQPVVQRTAALMANIQRGSIYDRHGNLLASDLVDEQGTRARVYPDPSFAHITGYVTGIRTGAAGLELGYNQTLLGLNRVDTQLSRLVHQPLTGSDLVLTLDSELQHVAEEALGGRTGAVVALDGNTGAVLAMVSIPRYNPNQIFEDGYVGSLLSGCSAVPGCNAPFLNRATQARYPPGSTWKTVTLIAALDTGLVTPETVFDFGQPLTDPQGNLYYVYVVDGFPTTDPNHQERQLSLPMAYARSANAAFARMGDEMEPSAFVDYANRLGFVEPGQQTFAIEIPYLPSQLANEQDELLTNDVLRASTAIGQGELLVTPLNMAMVALSALNEGDIPMPHLVHYTHDPTGLDHRGPLRRSVVRDVMRPETARLVREMMITSAIEGARGRALIEGLVVGGKTGTAQLGGNLPPHAWYLGFAEDGETRVVIAVVLEHGGEGSLVALPVFTELVPFALEAARSAVIADLP